jgi:hypothetical protein
MALRLNNVNPVSNVNQNIFDQRMYPNPPIGGVGGTLLGNFLGRGKVGVYRRQIVTFTLPNRLESVQMYINPQNFKVDKRKLITGPVRTRGGFMVQYWGEEFDKISLSGTTGSSGIEGINLLEEVYRTEQQDFQGLAQALLQRVKSGNFNDFVSGDVFRNVVNFGKILSDSSTQPGSFQRLLLGGDNGASLADIATNVRINYQGITYRGYFTSFSVTESAESPGLFDYIMEFTVIETIGKRLNFMPWHRVANAGPANSETIPYSYSTQINGANTATRAISELIAGVFTGIAGLPGVPDARESLLRDQTLAQSSNTRVITPQVRTAPTPSAATTLPGAANPGILGDFNIGISSNKG